jgi:hypothetical protein
MLRLQIRFKWDLQLEPKSETDLSADFWLSTLFSHKVITVKELRKASGETNLILQFPLLTDFSPRDLLKDCVLNIDFTVHTSNAYNECVPNPAGCVMVSLLELLTAKNDDTATTADVYLFMVHEPQRKVKGSVTISPMAPIEGSASRPVMITHNGGFIDPLLYSGDAGAALLRHAALEAKRRTYIAMRAISASDEIYGNDGGLRPTMATVKRVNSTIYVMRAGVTLPLFFTTDVVEPEIGVDFLGNCMEIVRRRMRLKVSDLMALDLNRPTPHALKTFGSFVGQVLCAYVIHCSYREDFVMSWDVLQKKFVKVLTENFGDVTVDKGCGDCEDFGKIIVRVYLAFRRYRLDPTEPLSVSPLMAKVSEFLACFVSFLVLYGVSSAEINEDPKKIKKMGAHENAMVTPLSQVIEEIRRFHPDIDEWVSTTSATTEPKLLEYIERSKRYQSLILEGTGVLEPTPDTEATIAVRKLIERYMSDESFYALRRSYYYDDNNNSFYKTVDKLFSPNFLLSGARFGSFIVLQETPESLAARPAARANMPLRERYTKSADFSRFIKNSPTVAMIMEPHLELEEIKTARHVLKDLHPPEAMRSPPRHFEKRDKCDAVIEAAFKNRANRSYEWEYRSEPFNSGEMVDPPTRAGLVEQVYYLRSGKVYPECLEAIERTFDSLARHSGSLKRVIFYPEWTTTVVGGYRIVLEMDASKVK